MPAAVPATSSASAEESGATAEMTSTEEITGTPTAGVTEEITSTEGITTDSVEVVKAFYNATGALEYEKAITFVADDAVFINPNGIYTGTEANLAQITENGEAGIIVEISSLRNVEGIVVYHLKVFLNGDLLVEADNGINIVENGKIIFDGDTFNMPLAEDPTAPIEVVKAFYVALNAKEYEKAMTFVADDATLNDDTGSHQGVDEISAHIMEAGEVRRSYDIWDISEIDGAVSYNVRVYQGDMVIYETMGSNVVKDGKITMTSMVEQ